MTNEQTFSKNAPMVWPVSSVCSRKKNNNENNCCWTVLIIHTIESEFVERKLQAITACQICMVSRLHFFYLTRKMLHNLPETWLALNFMLTNLEQNCVNTTINENNNTRGQHNREVWSTQHQESHFGFKSRSCYQLELFVVISMSTSRSCLWLIGLFVSFQTNINIKTDKQVLWEVSRENFSRLSQTLVCQ